MNEFFELARTLFDVYVNFLGLFIILVYWVSDIEITIIKKSYHKKSWHVFPRRINN